MRRVTTVADFAAWLASRTNPEKAADWDPVGLQLGDPSAEVETVAVCHEVTEEVISQLEPNGVDLLVTYHPLLFAKTNRILSGRSAQARAFQLIQMGVGLLVTHTDFDVAPGGMADKLAALFKLRDVESFGADPDEPEIGRVGDFEGSLAAVDALATDAFGVSGLRVSGDPKRTVERLAVVPGSGSSLIEAAAERADALVTGDVGHHRVVLARDLGLAVVDPGHIATERPGIGALYEMVSESDQVAAVDLTRIDPETWA